MKIESLSTHKKKFQTDRMKVPAILHASDELLPNDKTLAQLENTASQEYVFHHIAALSDVHDKKGRKNPTGTVVASEKYLLPQINDTAPNCGMRFLKTNLTDADLTPENIDKLFNALLKPVPTKAYVGTPVPYSLVVDICRYGLKPVTEYFHTRTKNEIENTFKNGNFFDQEISQQDITDAIPQLFLWIGKFRLGILGAAGNHFLDLMKISEIKDPEMAEKFGLKKGQYIFMFHTGSGLLGQYASYLYTPKKKEHLSQRIVLELGKLFWRSGKKNIYKKIAKKIAEYKNKDEFFAYDADSPEGKMFLTAHQAAGNQGFANRSILTHNLDQTIEKILGKDPEFDLLYDSPHLFINRENHFGKDVWVHRNGAVRAQAGEPVFIPSSMSTPMYLGIGTDENESTFFSAGHGTGRRKNPETNTAGTKEELFAKMNNKKVKLFNAKSKGVVFQDSGYYKDVEEVIAGMEENKIVKPVAKMEPIAVLMY
ncbi:MAG TPA: RtcB family protein [Candidatus Saccharimonadales bacterium]|nr:RtcB family protein [Candidatus Saccharimonadales bacterium]